MKHDGASASYVQNEVSQRRCSNALNEHLDRRTLHSLAFGDRPIPDEIQPNLSDHRHPCPGGHGVLLKERGQCFLVNIRRL